MEDNDDIFTCSNQSEKVMQPDTEGEEIQEKIVPVHHMHHFDSHCKLNLHMHISKVPSQGEGLAWT